MAKKREWKAWMVVSERGAWRRECCGLPLIAPSFREANNLITPDSNERIIRVRIVEDK